MGHPLVSVIIPVHNTEKYLPQCLETVFAQTLTDFEVICVDDGSTDSSLKILQKYQKKDSRLKIYRADNVGVSVARNIALSKATGKYIAFIDSDDFAHSQLLSKTTAQAEKTDADIVIFDYFLYQDPHGDLGTYRDQKIYQNLSTKVFSLHTAPEMIQFMGVWDRIFKRSFIEKNHLRFLADHIYEDAIFSVESMLKATRISLIADHLYFYRRGVSGSITFDEGKNEFKKNEFIFAQEYIQNILRKENANSEIKYFYLKYFIEYALMHQRFAKSKHDFQQYFSKIRAMIFPNFARTLPTDLVLKRKVYLFLLRKDWKNACWLLTNLANFPRRLRNTLYIFTHSGIRENRR